MVKHELGLSGDEAERIITSGRLVRNQQSIFDADGVPFPYPNGKVAHLVGSANVRSIGIQFSEHIPEFSHPVYASSGADVPGRLS